MSSKIANHRILVTGATSGLGKEMAYQLAVKHKAIVIATGRRMERLKDLQEKVVQQGGFIEPFSLDLMQEDQIDDFIKEISRSSLDGIILNAGVTVADTFEQGKIKQYHQLIQTNVAANIQLMHGLLNSLEKRKGRILIVSSLGGLVPVPYQSVYAGSKAFMVNLGLSLRAELKHKDISVGVFAPGGIATEMTEIDAFDDLRGALASVDSVAKTCINAYIKRKALVVPGIMNKLVVFFARFLPKTFIANQGEKIYRKSVTKRS